MWLEVTQSLGRRELTSHTLWDLLKGRGQGLLSLWSLKRQGRKNIELGIYFWNRLALRDWAKRQGQNMEKVIQGADFQMEELDSALGIQGDTKENKP